MTIKEAKALYDDRKFVLIDKRTFNNFVDKIYDDSRKQKSCDGCIHHLSANGNYPLSCGECSRFYADGFEEKK